MEQISIDSYVENALKVFGQEVNNNRQFVRITDGLKPVFRRTIFTAYQLGGKLVKSANIIGNCMAKYHPHGDKSIEDVVNALARQGVFESQGNFGLKTIYGDNIRAASPRYTEAKLADGWTKIFSDLMPYVPYIEAEIDGNVEPAYLPTPLPLQLLFSGIGIGYGANARYPMFTAQSMYDAFIHDDPSLLKAPAELTIDPSKSDLDAIWTVGLGKIDYKYKVEKCGISSGYGTMITGSAEIFKPNLEKAFEEELGKGQVYILDQTDSDIPKVFVGLSKGVRAISLDDIQKTCEEVCEYSRTFRITVTDGSSAFLIPLKEWIKFTYENYLKLIEKYKSDKINKINFDIEVYKWLGTVTKVLLEHRDYDAEKLSEVTNCDLDIVKAILRKSISTLCNTDSAGKIKDLESNRKYYEGIDPKVYTEELVKKL